MTVSVSEPKAWVSEKLLDIDAVHCNVVEPYTPTPVWSAAHAGATA
ncbi:MAG: hypothetical protein QNJ94_06795 [Alphaproteobacteria bacterium]|nr:hypothetical protein [Alphaproteobacteria bacterium]